MSKQDKKILSMLKKLRSIGKRNQKSLEKADRQYQTEKLRFKELYGKNK